MRSFAILLGLFASAAAQAATTGTLSATYDGYSHGMIVLKLNASLEMNPASYAAHLDYHTAGMIGWVVHNSSSNDVQGRFAAGSVLPAEYVSSGRLRGVARETHIVYHAGNPTVLTLQPPVDSERSAVPQALTAQTIDTLSAIALLIRHVGETGRCDGSARTFDGRRLTALTARTTGHETLPKIQKSIFAGDTLRCDFDGNQLAGFVKSEDQDQLRRTRHGTAWLAPLVPGAPPVPVRVVFDNKVLGQVTLYLTSINGSPGAVAQNRAGGRD
jgi:hypothetical protein